MKHRQRNPQQMGKLAGMLSLPLMAVVIVMASRALSTSAENRTPPEEGTLIVANLVGQSLSIHDLAGTAGTRTVAAPGPPHELLFHGGRVYMTLGRANLIAELDPAAPGILRTLAMDGGPHGLALADNSRLLVTLDELDEMAEVDLASFTEVGRSATGQTPHTVAYIDGSAYVTAARANLIEAYGVLKSEAPTGTLPESVAIAGKFVVTANAGDNSISVFNRANLRTEGAVTVGGSPVRVIALDDTHALVALGSTAEVIVVDLERMRVEHREKVGARPDGLCLSPSREFVAVVSNADDLARIFRLPTWTPVMALVTGSGPGACIWTGD